MLTHMFALVNLGVSASVQPLGIHIKHSRGVEGKGKVRHEICR